MWRLKDEALIHPCLPSQGMRRGALSLASHRMRPVLRWSQLVVWYTKAFWILGKNSFYRVTLPVPCAVICLIITNWFGKCLMRWLLTFIGAHSEPSNASDDISTEDSRLRKCNKRRRNNGFTIGGAFEMILWRLTSNNCVLVKVQRIWLASVPMLPCNSTVIVRWEVQW